MSRLLILIIALIVYGSLYPWRLRDPGPFGPFEVLLQSRSGPILLGDILVNVAIYIPIGACAYLVFRRSLLKPLLLGITLSAAIELIQVYQVSRKPSVYDLLANGVGTILGIAVGSMFAATSNRLRAAHAGALVILGCWVAYLCYPFVLTTSSLAAKSGAFLRSNPFTLIPFISAFASWFAAGLLFSEAGFRDVRRWLIASLAFIPAQLFLIGRQPQLAQAIGAFAGVAAFLSMSSIRTRLASVALLAALFVRGCAPFHFQPVASRFLWIPFAGSLGADWQSATLTLLEKLFYYSVTIWSARAAGFPLRIAATLVAAVLLAIEILQMYLPGRSPEITDPILALLIGFGLQSFKRTSNPSGTSA